MVAAQHLYFLLSSFCLFSSWRNNIPVRLCIFYCVKRCPNPSFHYYFFPMPYICQSRHVCRLSHNRQTSVCYLRFFQWVVSFNNQNFDINKLHGFIQTFIYWRPFGFLPITLLERKRFLKIVYICGNLYALKEFFISY